MRFLILVGMMSLGSLAFASDNNTMVDHDRLEGRHDVAFSCNFLSRDKKGVSCTAEGEVCVNFSPADAGHHECDHDRMRVACDNGWVVDGRAASEIRPDHDQDGLALAIATPGGRDDHFSASLVASDFDHFPFHKSFHSAMELVHRHHDDEVITNDPDRDHEHGRLGFFGRCELRLAK